MPAIIPSVTVNHLKEMKSMDAGISHEIQSNNKFFNNRQLQENDCYHWINNIPKRLRLITILKINSLK